jgi:hypothetical protein
VSEHQRYASADIRLESRSSIETRRAESPKVASKLNFNFLPVLVQLGSDQTFESFCPFLRKSSVVGVAAGTRESPGCGTIIPDLQVHHANPQGPYRLGASDIASAQESRFLRRLWEELLRLV